MTETLYSTLTRHRRLPTWVAAMIVVLLLGLAALVRWGPRHT